MFLCWGPVSLTGLEIGWSWGKAWPHQKQGGQGPTPAAIYDNLFKKWKPQQFDARKWVSLAKGAGARYLIFLVKHHDGFCLFDSKLTDYKSTGPEAAWKHDVFKDVADACHDLGLKLIVYYSQPDWHHPDYRTENHARYIAYLHGQIREILTQYGRIDGLWFDLGGRPQDWDSEKLFRMSRQLQPHLIINNRCGLPGDFDTPENSVDHFQQDRPWETCATLGRQWSWKPNDELRSREECLHMLITCAVGNGNLALNTGPMPDGPIEPRQAERFREIGHWLAKYGESIYGTRGGPFRAPDERLTKAGLLREVHHRRWTLVGRKHPQGKCHLSAHSPLAVRIDPATGHRPEDRFPLCPDGRFGNGRAGQAGDRRIRPCSGARPIGHHRQAGARWLGHGSRPGEGILRR